MAQRAFGSLAIGWAKSARRRSVPLVCLVACCGWPGAVWAQAADPASEAASQPQAFEHQVVVRGESRADRDRERAFQVSVGATTVSQETIRAEAPTSLADALRTAAPSVSIQQTTPGQGTIYVRGLSGRAVVYAVDGVRLNMAFFRAGNNDYLGLIDPYAASSVVVVPGAASVEYGSDALGGAVLMNSEALGFRAGEPRVSYRVFQSLTSNPLGTASRVVALREGAALSGQLGFTYYQAGPIRPGEDLQSPDPESYFGLERDVGSPYAPLTQQKQLGTEFELYAADATLRGRLGHGTELLLKGQYAVRPELVRYDQVTPRFKSELPARAQRSLQPMSRAMVSATLKHRKNGGFYDLAEVQLSWQRIFERRVDRRLDERCIDPVAEPTPEPEDCAGRLQLVPRAERVFEDNSSNAFSLRSELRKANRSGSVSGIAGFTLHHDIVSSETETLDFATQVREPNAARYPDGSTVSEAGVFTHLRLRLAPTLAVFAGARGGLFVVAMEARGGDEPTDSFNRTVGDVVGTIGTRWELAPGLAWVLNGARGVRAPNVEDLAAVGARASSRYQIANPDLRAEHSYTADTGLKVSSGRHRAHAMVFVSRYADAIALAPTTVDGESLTAEGDEYFHSVNATSVDMFGAEASFDVGLTQRCSSFGRALVMSGTQFNEAETGLPAETPADRVPPAQGELGLRFQVLDSLQLEGFAVGRAPQRRLNDPVNLEDNRIPEGGTPGYTTYHARLRYTPDPAVMARLSFDNISNELALDHGSGFYRPGFGVTASVELALDRALYGLE